MEYVFIANTYHLLPINMLIIEQLPLIQKKKKNYCQ